MEMQTIIADVSIRDFADSDWDSVAALMNLHKNLGVTGDLLRERQSGWKPGDPRTMVVAVDGGGEIVAFARSGRRFSDPEGKFSIALCVHPKFEGRGLGRRLHALNESFARSHGGRLLGVVVEDERPRSSRFAELAGFYPIQHLFQSKLDVTNFDAAPYHLLQRELESVGYEFKSLVEIGDTIENWRKLHELDSKSDLDTPGVENWGPRPFERYLQDTRHSKFYLEGGIHVAVFEGEWVGTNIVTGHPSGEPHTDYTGVLRDHRGKGVAQVLKALGIEFCRRSNAAVLITNNDERNAPMLAINAKLGFVVKPGFRLYRKDLE